MGWREDLQAEIQNATGIDVYWDEALYSDSDSIVLKSQSLAKIDDTELIQVSIIIYLTDDKTSDDLNNVYATIKNTVNDFIDNRSDMVGKVWSEKIDYVNITSKNLIGLKGGFTTQIIL
jgi:hypothetical protein